MKGADRASFWFVISAVVVGLFVVPAVMAACSIAWELHRQHRAESLLRMP